MYNFSVIEATDDHWTKVINKSKSFDFYHTQSYHLLDKENRAVLFVADFEDGFIAMPLVIRSIPDTNLYDCTSVYGYCGPVSNQDLGAIESVQLEFFRRELLLFFEENSIITAFSRLHPLIDATSFFKDFGEVVAINKTIAIDLRQDNDTQRSQYRKSIKYDINQLIKKGYQVVEATTKEDVDAFISIYYENMDRVHAAPSYYFSRDYFYEFLKNNCFESKLLLAKKEGEIAAGAIFTITNKIMQYHLAGTSSFYIKDTPMKLILDEARLLGTELQLDFLHLGGGAGGSDEDSLFLFKSGFSNYRCQFSVWKFIVNHEKYNELQALKGITEASNFFPLYRLPKN